jgi:Fur family zinc uptake transcriptional regulator
MQRPHTAQSVLKPFEGAAHSHQRCVSDALAAAEQACARRGQRLTELRRRVLELVWGSHEPVKAYDVLERLRTNDRRAAPPTVYRALDFLMTYGLVHRIESLNAYVGCGAPDREHGGQFLICQRCGAVAEMDDKDIRNMLRSRAAALGFSVTHQTIELQGLCEACLQRADSAVSSEKIAKVNAAKKPA